ncbi:MAG TPA: CDC48 family AAA ATPase [Nitrososphaerales archaeon]
MAKERKVMAVQLKVAEAKQRDVGKGRARLDVETMEALEVSAGDVIEIIGKRATVATAWPADPEDSSAGIIRVDGQSRKNSNVSVDDFVSVRRADAKAARSVTLAPVGGKLVIDPDFCEFVKNRLKGFALTEGDDATVVILGSPILFTAIKIIPKPIVKIDQNTKLNISNQAVPEKKGIALSYEEIGGLKVEIRRLREIAEIPLRHPEVFQRLGIEPPSGILLYGPPGCGKTLLAKALASEVEANFLVVNGPEIMNKYYGETEGRLREIFKEGKENAPSIIFIDEIDAIAPKREEVFGDVEKRVVAQLLALMDGLSERGDVIVIGATNRPDSIDPALRRPGRFDREIEISVPNREGRLEILQIHTRGMPLAPDVSLTQVASELHGYTGADLRALCREAALKSLRRFLPEIELEGEQISPEILEAMTVNAQDFRDARKEIVPTAMREFYVEIPSVPWSSIGGLEDIKKKLQENVIWALTKPEVFHKVGVKPPRGVLMYGPPGCGKTLLARAIATESGANFITVRGPEILSKWVGESEKAVREIFRKARTSTPCIIFFDEIDSIAAGRSMESEDSGVGERVLSQLLTEIDTISSSEEVFVIGATNRPDILDISLLRPGRLDLLIYIKPSDEQARKEILRMITQKMPIGEGVSIDDIAKRTEGYSGADLEALCREAALSSLRRNDTILKVLQSDFDNALSAVKPSISKEVEEWYSSLYKRISSRVPRREKGFYG